MGPGGAPQKSIFWSQKWHFPDFLVRGSVEGRGGCNFWRLSRSSGGQPLYLGNLTPSPDSRELSLRYAVSQ